jgi:hypothetical protein
MRATARLWTAVDAVRPVHFAATGVAIVLAVSCGIALLYYPMAALIVALTTSLVALVLATGVRAEKGFLVALAVLLVGYAMLGRGFAYIGFDRFFVGDAVLFVGLIVFASRRIPFSMLKSRESALLLAFCGWGIARTVPYLPVHGWFALRDGALWGYAAFAFMTCACIVRAGALPQIPRLYARFLVVLVAWIPVAVIIYRLYPTLIPHIRDGSVPIIQIEPGDTLVHLTGVAVFLMLGLNRLGGAGEGALSKVHDWAIWLPWIVAFFVASVTRAGLLAMLAGLALTVLFQPRSRWGRCAFVGLTITMLWVWTGKEIDLGVVRKISPQQVAISLYSIVGVDLREGLEGSRTWRLSWWHSIVDYTFDGPYFWGGKGFGVNLADDDGFQVTADSALRSPHSAHLNVLARMGVPGFALWSGFHLAFGSAMFRKYRHARLEGHDTFARVVLWIMAYWVAFLVNMSFDLTIENPHGGIWFWSICGCALALLMADDDVQRALGARNEPKECM